MNTQFLSKIKLFCSRHPLISGLILMFIIGVVLVWLAMIFLDIWTHHGDNATVPDIKNMTYTQAAGVLEQHDLQIEISDSLYDRSVAPGTIMESWPKAGATVKRGRQVYVTITAFAPKQVTISSPITGVSVRQAVSYLKALGIASIRLVNVPSDYPDLVEGAHSDGRPLGVGSMLPVDASVVLEVGTVPDMPDESYETDSISAEQSIADDLSGYSTYTDDESDF